MLTEEQKNQIKKFINSMEIEIEDLSSYRCQSHSAGWDRFAEPDDEDWDEDEEYEVQGSEAIKTLEYDGVEEHFDGWSPDLKDEIIGFIEEETGC